MGTRKTHSIASERGNGDRGVEVVLEASGTTEVKKNQLSRNVGETTFYRNNTRQKNTQLRL